MDDFFAPGGLWEGACNAPLKKTAPSARLAPKGVQKEVPKTILRGMIFHQVSERKLVKLVFSPGRCCEFRDFDNRISLLFFRLSEIVSKMLAKTSFRKVGKSLVNTVSNMTWDFSGGPEGRSKATFLGTEIVKERLGRALLSPKTASGPWGRFLTPARPL